MRNTLRRVIKSLIATSFVLLGTTTQAGITIDVDTRVTRFNGLRSLDGWEQIFARGDLSGSITSVKANLDFAQKEPNVYASDFGLLFVDTGASNDTKTNSILYTGNSTTLNYTSSPLMTIARTPLPGVNAVADDGYATFAWGSGYNNSNTQNMNVTISGTSLGDVATTDASRLAVYYANGYYSTSGSSGQWVGSLTFEGTVSGESSVYDGSVPEPATAMLYGMSILGLLGVRRRLR